MSMKKNSGKPAVATKQPTRQKLVEAAHSLIWANSYAHVSVDDICRAAGVQKGSFYHFFPTKADLAAAALEDHWVQMKPKLDEIFAQHLSPSQQLRALCDGIYFKQQDALESTGKVCGCPYATVAAELSGSNTVLRTLSQQMTERFLAYFEKLLNHAAREGLIERAGIKQRAYEMNIYVVGAMLQSRVGNSLEPVGKSLVTAMERMCGFKAARKSTGLPRTIVSLKKSA